jgi:hypothetical protein
LDAAERVLSAAGVQYTIGDDLRVFDTPIAASGANRALGGPGPVVAQHPAPGTVVERAAVEVRLDTACTRGAPAGRPPACP